MIIGKEVHMKVAGPSAIARFTIGRLINNRGRLW